MRDKAFLTWLHERLEHVHNENPQTDYMGKLRSIIAALPDDQETSNTAPELQPDTLSFEQLRDCAMTVRPGTRVMLDGRVFTVETTDSAKEGIHRFHLTDVASPGYAMTEAERHRHHYEHLWWHVRSKQGRNASMLRGKWIKVIEAGDYTIDPPVAPAQG